MAGLVRIRVHASVNGLAFGTDTASLVAILGEPERAEHNYTGELEMRYDDVIYRCEADRFVECTFPDGDVEVGGMRILSVYDWLRGCSDCLDLAKFRISLAQGIAYDNRDPRHGSITVFERGRWDALVLSRAPR